MSRKRCSVIWLMVIVGSVVGLLVLLVSRQDKIPTTSKTTTAPTVNERAVGQIRAATISEALKDSQNLVWVDNSHDKSFQVENLPMGEKIYFLMEGDRLNEMSSSMISLVLIERVSIEGKEYALMSLMFTTDLNSLIVPFAQKPVRVGAFQVR